MPQTFKVDQASTFNSVALLSCEPKLAFGSQTEQEKTRAGDPKWEVQVVAGFRDPFGRTMNEVLKVGMVGESNPARGIEPYTAIEMRGFEVGVMDKTKADGTILGAQVWYRCEEIRDLRATSAPKQQRQPAHAEG